MANPKQLFRGHLVQQRGDTRRSRTLQPPSLFKYNPDQDAHRNRSSGGSGGAGVGDYLHSTLRSKVATLTMHQQMNTANRKASKCLKARQMYLSWRLNSDAKVD